MLTVGVTASTLLIERRLAEFAHSFGEVGLSASAERPIPEVETLAFTARKLVGRAGTNCPVLSPSPVLLASDDLVREQQQQQMRRTYPLLKQCLKCLQHRSRRTIAPDAAMSWKVIKREVTEINSLKRAVHHV